MDEAYNNPITFWNFLKQYTCVIPIIQRDYAQGRKGKESLRKKFFGKIIESLKEKKSLMLDFVYGYPKDDGTVVYPLDGQQRLTSLWLLYWYLAYKSGVPSSNETFWNRMKKFTYQTRTSSREFCERICQELKVLPLSKDDKGETIIPDVKNVIQSQPWFSRRFKKDPTVQAMLRSLSDIENNSGFEQLLQEEDFEALFNLLISEDCPIRFYFRSSKDEHIVDPDDLYVKMNARGKKLTQFENFKAELFSYKDDSGLELFRFNDGLNFIKRHENQWTNLFWTLRHSDHNIVDHIQLEFFNRMALAFLTAFNDVESNGQKLYEHITKHLTFTSIDIYRPVLCKDFKRLYAGVLNGICAIGRNGVEVNDLFKYPYSFRYLPQYENQDADKTGVFEVEENNFNYTITDISVRRIVSFYAASLYFYFFYQNTRTFSCVHFDPVTFDDWMFFARNLFNNSGIDTYAGAKSILNVFNQINRHCLNIIEFLDSSQAKKISIQGDLIKAQFEEEIQKAMMISASRKGHTDIAYQELIREAEMWEPFDGAIRFLFTNADGHFDWSDFVTKKASFENIRALSSEYWKDEPNPNKFTPLALRKLISFIDSWEDIDGFWYDSRYESWYEILLRKPRLCRYVHQLLTTPLDSDYLKNFISGFEEPIQRDIQEDLVKSEFLYQTTWDRFGFRRGSHTVVVWRSSAQWKRYLIGTPRNRLMAEGIAKLRIDINVVESQLLGDGAHLWGEDFYFDIIGNNLPYIFWWHSNEIRRANDVNDKRKQDVYLCMREGGHAYLDEGNPEKYAIIVPYNSSFEEFEKQLFDLLDRAKKCCHIPSDIYSLASLPAVRVHAVVEG